MSETVRRNLTHVVLVASAGLVLAALAAEPLVRAALPLLQRAFEVAAPDFRVIEFGVNQIQGERRLAVAVTLSRSAIVGSRVLAPNPKGRAEAMTAMAHALHGAVLALVAAAAWPTRTHRAARERLCWVIVVLPLAALLLVVDAPFVLAANLWQLLIDALAPGEPSALIAWSTFLRGGGRFALALAAAAAAVLVCARARRRANQP